MTLRLEYDGRALGAATIAFLGCVVGIVGFSLDRHGGLAGEGDDTKLEMVLLAVNIVASGIVYLIALHTLPPKRSTPKPPPAQIIRPNGGRGPDHTERSPKLVVEDLLQTCAISLGKDYRLHIMKLRPGHDPVIPFGFVAVYNMQNLQQVEENIKWDTSGVGTAFANPGRIIVLGPNDMDKAIDPIVQHIWSGRIRGTNCVLTTDSTVPVLDTQVYHVREVVDFFRVILKKYNVESLRFFYETPS